MHSGLLNKRVSLEARVITRDASGGTIETWQPVATVWAGIAPLSGREFVAAQSVQAGVTTRITIRWRAGIDASMRLVHEGLIYNVRAVLPDPTLRRHITLMCEQGVNDG